MPETRGLTNPAAPRFMLVEALRNILVPEIKQLGFERHKLPLVLGGHCSTRIEPFGQFKRPRGDATDLAAVRIDRRRPDTFDIAFGTVPPGPISNKWGPDIAHDDVWVEWLPTYYYILPSGKSLRRFRVRKWPWCPPVSQVDYDDLARQVVAFLPEMEAAFATGKARKHVRFVDCRDRS
jgi:hypothetical protein